MGMAEFSFTLFCDFRLSNEGLLNYLRLQGILSGFHNYNHHPSNLSPHWRKKVGARMDGSKS